MTSNQYSQPVNTVYHGFFQNGTSIWNYNLKSVSEVPDIEHIVKVEYIGQKLTKYTLVNLDGTLGLLRCGGNFELRDIGHEIYDGIEKLHKADVVLYDLQNQLPRTFRIKTEAKPEVMMQELLALFNGLKEAGNYETYMKFARIEELEKVVERLTQENQELRDKVKELQAAKIDSIQ